MQFTILLSKRKVGNRGEIGREGKDVGRTESTGQECHKDEVPEQHGHEGLC